MIRAYSKLYLDKAMIALGRMLEIATYDLNYSLLDFWQLFLRSNVCHQLEICNPKYVVGKSPTELVFEIVGNTFTPTFKENRSREFWCGWALAYFKWYTALSYEQITSYISIEEILGMYSPYHEMDVNSFTSAMVEIYNKRKTDTNLKLLRIKRGMSQNELSVASGVPLRTIQQYEQRQKCINNAKASYVVSLSMVLRCTPLELLEVVME